MEIICTTITLILFLCLILTIYLLSKVGKEVTELSIEQGKTAVELEDTKVFSQSLQEQIISLQYVHEEQKRILLAHIKSAV